MARPLGYPSSRLFDWLGFAAPILSFGYVALQSVLAGERRLLSIESELAVARRLQLGSLPGDVPQLEQVRVAAVHEPMTAMAGDFYEFVPKDAHRAGFLVADVSGHGVPAALVASTIKVAMRSVAARPDDPEARLLLYTDGLTEPENASGEPFGDARQDDITVLVVDALTAP